MHYYLSTPLCTYQCFQLIRSYLQYEVLLQFYYNTRVYKTFVSFKFIGINTSRRNVNLSSDTNDIPVSSSHGQYGYNGYVINLPQDVPSFILPRHPNDLDIIVVRQ